ncbi:MAG: RNA polymerase subunit sigma-70, partial [Planctomycetota bacterium]
MNRYRHPAMKQFTDQQVRFAPQERKLEQLDRAERLLDEIESGRSYPYQYVCFRITEYRPDTYPDLVLDGDDLVHDLLLFIEELSASADIPLADAGEPVLT